jgi:hypothetical protein
VISKELDIYKFKNSPYFDKDLNNRLMETLKSELIRKIISTSDENLLEQISLILKNEKPDFWNELTDRQKKEIEVGLGQAVRGETISWDDFLRKVS